MIVVAADHGDMLGEHGLFYKKHFFEDCIRVPLIIHWPTRFAASHQSRPSSLLDLLPTLCDLAGLPLEDHAPHPLDGPSLVSACEGDTDDTAPPVYAEITSEGVPEPMFMVRNRQYKLLSGGDAPPVLFDLDNDPHERTDLASDPTHADARRELEALTQAQWDPDTLQTLVTISQRQRRLVHAAQQNGKSPNWEHQPEDATTAWLLRSPEGYNDWAWKGIDEV